MKTNQAMEKFQTTLPEYHRLLTGHRILQKFFPKWKEEFDMRINLDMYTAERSLSVLPGNFIDDEKVWIDALKIRMNLLNKNMIFVHEQRQHLEKVHEDLSNLITIFNKTHNFILLEDLPAFEPQNCKKKQSSVESFEILISHKTCFSFFVPFSKDILPETPRIVQDTPTDEGELHEQSFDGPSNLTFAEKAMKFADRALKEFSEAKEDIKKFTTQMSEAKKYICRSKNDYDSDERYKKLQKYRFAERRLDDAKFRMREIVDHSQQVITKIAENNVPNCEWEVEHLIDLVQSYENLQL